jgi:NADH:ubiquinone oxidoreductase subunit 3 (subunit A)
MDILLKVPVLFIIFMVIFGAMMLYLKRYEKKARNGAAKGDGEDDKNAALAPYACGHRNYESYVNPDYKQFVKYAFVFSVMHVLVMVVTTAPKGEMWLPLAYVAAGVLALAIIFRK